MSDEGKETARLEAFSDGVFAIAITLLSIDLKAPHLPEEAPSSELTRALASAWPSYAAFTLSFFSILVMWLNHHGLFRLVRRTSPLFMFANGLLLFLVAAVPFPTALVSEYLRRPGGHAAAVIYCGFFVGIGVAYNLLWRAVLREGLLRPHVDPAIVRAIDRSLHFGLAVYAAAALLSAFSSAAGLVLCSALWIHWSRLVYVAHRQ